MIKVELLSLEFEALQIWQDLPCLTLPHFLINTPGFRHHREPLLPGTCPAFSHGKPLCIQFLLPDFFFPGMSACYNHEHF